MSAEIFTFPGVEPPGQDTSVKDNVIAYLRGLADTVENGTVDPKGLIIITPVGDTTVYLQRIGLGPVECAGYLSMMQARLAF